MLQPSSRVCSTCQTVAAPDQQFCARCGASLPAAPSPMGYAPTVAASSGPAQGYAPTVAASSGPAQGYVPTVAASEPSSGPVQNNTPVPAPPPPHTHYPANGYSTTGAPPPPYQAGDPYMSTPPAPGYGQPANPMSSASYGQQANYAPTPGYNQAPNYAPAYNYGQPPKNKPQMWLYITIGVVVLVVLGGGLLAWIGANGKGSGGGGNSANGNYSTSQSLSNLSIVYASDQMTFTSIQQASSFSDDDLSSFNEHPNYVRVNFKEQQTSNNSSVFGYDESFRLILPDHSVVAAQKAADYTGPEQAVVRTNWVDFPTSAKVDLSNLTLRVGAQDEAQMDVPLKSGANLNQYQPKTVNPGTQFQYAKGNWTILSATQSLYYNGQQAKTGQVYITVNLKDDNNSTYEVWLYGSFVHLKANGNSIAPELGSNTNAFDDMQPGTTNHQGSVTFLTQPSANGSYILDFLPDQNNDWPEQTANLQIS